MWLNSTCPKFCSTVDIVVAAAPRCASGTIAASREQAFVVAAVTVVTAARNELTTLLSTAKNIFIETFVPACNLSHIGELTSFANRLADLPHDGPCQSPMGIPLQSGSSLL
jgi:hypothetical protein